MSFDPNVPQELKEIQTWFADVITQPIDEKSHINPISPTGESTAKEAKHFIAPSPTLTPLERIELYNQQYWWRLLNTLQSSFPLVTNLLGYHQFNETIAVPYLEMHPSHHWSLSYLGSELPEWLRKEYKGKDQQIMTDAVDIDWAYNASFFAAKSPSPSEKYAPDKASATKVLSERLFLQPHLFLFTFAYDLFHFRDQIKQKDPDYWSNHHYANLKHALSEGEKHFPELKKDRNYYYVLYRNPHNFVTHQEVEELEYHLLEKFKSGSTLLHICEELEKGNPAHFSEASVKLKPWIEGWLANQWLSS